MPNPIPSYKSAAQPPEDQSSSASNPVPATPIGFSIQVDIDTISTPSHDLDTAKHQQQNKIPNVHSRSSAEGNHVQLKQHHQPKINPHLLPYYHPSTPPHHISPLPSSSHIPLPHPSPIPPPHPSTRDTFLPYLYSLHYTPDCAYAERLYHSLTFCLLDQDNPT